MSPESNPSASEIGDGRLPPCPASPNCVCSDDPDEGHRIDPFPLATAPEAAWAALRSLLESWPRATVVSATPLELRVEVRSRLFRFVDVLEFRLRPADRRIAVRSAARLGYSDFGVNRRRLESIRSHLKAAGVIGAGTPQST